MAVTQYIGARYVPVFADPAEWSSAKQYEPLTIVLHEGNSFTSKQFVPVGVDIDDTDYWAETGNYNAQVEAYREEVLRFSDSIQEKAFAFDTVADMQESTQLYVGAICHTNGFYSKGDGGAAWYVVSGTGTPNDMDVISCEGELVANLVTCGRNLNVRQFGAYGDDIHDDSTILQYVLDKSNFYATESGSSCDNVVIYLPSGTYLTTVSLYVNAGCHLIGEGSQPTTAGALQVDGITSIHYTGNGTALYSCCKRRSDNGYQTYRVVGTDIDTNNYASASGVSLENINLYCNQAARGLVMIGTIDFKLSSVSILNFELGLYMNSSWIGIIEKTRITANQVGLFIDSDVNQTVFDTFTAIVTGSANTVAIINEDLHPNTATAAIVRYAYGVTFNVTNLWGDRTLFVSNSTGVVFNSAYLEGIDVIAIETYLFNGTFNGIWIWQNSANVTVFEATGGVFSITSFKDRYNVLPYIVQHGAVIATINGPKQDTVYVGDYNGTPTGASNHPYATLEDAILHVNEGGTIILLKSLTISNVVVTGKRFRITRPSGSSHSINIGLDAASHVKGFLLQNAIIMCGVPITTANGTDTSQDYMVSAIGNCAFHSNASITLGNGVYAFRPTAGVFANMQLVLQSNVTRVAKNVLSGPTANNCTLLYSGPEVSALPESSPVMRVI